MSIQSAVSVPTRRNTELVLLIFAVLVVVAAEGAVEGTRNGNISHRLIIYGSVPLGAGIIAHLIIRRVAAYADPLLLPCVVLLSGLGLVMIHRLDLGEQQTARQNGDAIPSASAPSQMLWTAVGLVLFLVLIIVVRDHRILQRYAYTLALAGLFFLILPAVLPASVSEVAGARIWIRAFGFSIQPGEFAKVLLPIFAASYLVSKREVLSLAGRRFLGIDLPRGRDFGPILVAWLICIGVLIRGRDLGTSLLFFGLFIVLLYVATERVSWVIVGVLMFALGAYASYKLFDTVQTRVAVWLHVFTDPNGYQLSQSLFGLGTGGLFGTGLGAGHPELVPLPATDFIISSFGEELGLFGLVALLLVYLIFITRGFAAGLAVRDSFGKLLATGLSFELGLQLFVVVAGVSRLLPETGLTTPFLSAGGSSLIANWMILALLLRISDSSRRPAREAKHAVPRPEPTDEFVPYTGAPSPAATSSATSGSAS
jgi:cell division protein FtsW (lipid II flippase)